MSNKALPPASMPDLDTPEQLYAMLEQLENQTGGNMDDMPPELADLLRNVRKEKGIPTEEDVPTEDVVPEPSFVVKTADDKGQKVFVNIVASSKVPAPGNWTGGVLPDEVEAALANLDNIEPSQAEALRFPLSLGSARTETDRKGEACAVFDVMLNAEVLTTAARMRALKNFLIELALSWISSKASVQLDRKFKLPKMRYKGDLPPPSHRIRVDCRSLVTEISELPDNEPPTFALRASKLPPSKQLQQSSSTSTLNSSIPAAQQHSSGFTDSASVRQQGAACPAKGSTTDADSSTASRELHHSIEYVGRPVEAVHLSVEIPTSSASCGSGSSVHVEVCGRNVHVAVPRCRELTVRLPFAVAAAGASAHLDVGRLRLLLRLPYLPLAGWVEAMRAETPHAFGDIQFANQSFLELEP